MGLSATEEKRILAAVEGISFEPSDVYEQARLELARTHVDDAAGVQKVLERVTKVSAEVIGVERVGLWLFESAGAVLRCAAMYHRSEDRHTRGAVLAPMRYPTYVQAIEQRREIVADDARRHPYTMELTDSYLEPMGITSMLDAPVYRHGLVAGVVCHEHVGPPRVWTLTERTLAACMADVIALILEQAKRLRVQAALRESEEKRLELYRMQTLGEFAAKAAHDFNNAITVVLGSLELALLESPGGEHLTLARDAALRARGVVAQLMEFGRAASFEPRHTDLTALVQAARGLLEFHCRTPHALVLDLQPVGPVQADPTHLDRVLLNLVTNARDAMPTGGAVHVATRRELRAGKPGVVLEVRDDGVGMDAATLSRIFDPYFTTKGREGSGLGLASVHGIVHQSGGVIDVASAPGQGTTVRVWLPEAQS